MLKSFKPRRLAECAMMREGPRGGDQREFPPLNLRLRYWLVLRNVTGWHQVAVGHFFSWERTECVHLAGCFCVALQYSMMFSNSSIALLSC